MTINKYIYTIVGCYVVVAAIGCYPMGMLFGKVLTAIGKDVEYVACEVKNNQYYHCYLLVNGRIHEPRFLGLFKMYTVLYDDIVMRTTSANEFSYWAENMMFC